MAKKAPIRKPTRETDPDESQDRMQHGRASYAKATSEGVPVNRAAEQAVIGSMMLNPNVIDEVALLLKYDDFWGEDHREIFAQLIKQHEEGKKFDVMVFANRLTKAGMMELCGGPVYLGELALAVPTAGNYAYYAAIVREYAQRRRLLLVGYDCVSKASDLTAPFQESLGEAERGVLVVGEREAGEQHTRPLRDVLLDSMASIDARRHGEIVGQASGYDALDDMLGGFRPGDMVVLAARPSMGKTAFACNLAVRTATQGLPVLFISLEMTSLLVAERFAAIHSKVALHHMQKGTATPEERKRFVEGVGELSNLPILIDDCPSRTVGEIGALARRHKRKHGLGLLVIDYLQLIVPENTRENRQDQVSMMSRRVKALARELACPVVCIAQLNREAAKASDTRPRVHQLRESGAIEQDADTILLVHRESYYSHQHPPAGQGDPAELIVGKQRNGPTGTVKLLWFAGCQRFEAASERDEWEQGQFFEGEAPPDRESESTDTFRRPREERQTHY